ncbi:MAG: hypothetical protein CL429_03825 [Acidimicrobiaceae bacterium]|nr:hypothetical protein [Acidimicrobiaceae bacterium]
MQETPEQKYIRLYKEMSDLCEQQRWGDPFSYARSKEILAAIELGHTVADTFSGADAFRTAAKVEPLEYKSTTGKTCKGSYTGVSVQPTWEEQEAYLREKKLAPYDHFYNRFENGKLAESWEVPGQDVYNTLLPKMKAKYDTVLTKKDPRLSAVMSWDEIQTFGKRVK